MSFNFQSMVGPAEDVIAKIEASSPIAQSDRMSMIVEIISNALHELATALGSEGVHVALSASGHAGENPGAGDSVSISASTLPAPDSSTVMPSVDPAAPAPVDPTVTTTSVFAQPVPVEPTPTGVIDPATPPAAPVTPDAPSTLAQDHAVVAAPPIPDATAPADAPVSPTTVDSSQSADPASTVTPSGAASDTLSQQQGTATVSVAPDSTQPAAPGQGPVDPAPSTTTGAVAPDATPPVVDPTGPAAVPPVAPDPPTAPADPTAPTGVDPSAPSASPLASVMASADAAPAADEFPLTNQHSGSPRFGQKYRDEVVDGKDEHVYASGERVVLVEVPPHVEPAGQAPVA